MQQYQSYADQSTIILLEEAVVEQLMDSGRDPDLIKEAIWIIRDTYKNCENPKFQIQEKVLHLRI